MLNSTENVDEFNELLKKSRYPDQDSGKKTTWRDSDYEKAKLSISDDGDGLGIGFIKHFMPGSFCGLALDRLYQMWGCLDIR